MADVRELPDHVREFVDMSKEYMRQETLEPAKQLGKFAGFVVAAAICFSLAALFLSVAGVRYLRELLPEGPIWSAVGYIIAAVVAGIVAGILVRFTNRAAPTEQLADDPFADTPREGA